MSKKSRRIQAQTNANSFAQLPRVVNPASAVPVAAGRPSLPAKTDEIGSETSVVPAADPNRNIQTRAKLVKFGGNIWDFSQLQNATLYPSPYDYAMWPQGFLPRLICMQMLRHPKVDQAENNLIASIIGNGGRVIPCVPPSHKDFKKAREIADFCSWSIRHMKGSWHSNLRQMATAVHEGNKAAVIVCRDEENSREYRNNRVLDELQILPNETYAYYLNEYAETVYLRIYTSYDDQQDWPRGKFAVLTYRPINNNPYGTKNLAAAYEPYYEDCQAVAELFAYAATFGRPSVVIYAPPPPTPGAKEENFALTATDGTPIMVRNIDGDLVPKMGTIVEQNGITFTEYRAGSVWSLEGGSKVEIAEPRSGGDSLFASIRDRAARMISAVIMGTHETTDSTKATSSGGSEASEAVTDLGVTDGKKAIEEMVENDIFTLLVDLNYGPSYRDLLPIYDLGSSKNARMARMLNSVVGFVTNGAFNEDQWWWFCIQNDLPLPYPDSPKLSDSTKPDPNAPVDPNSAKPNNGSGGGDNATKKKNPKPQGFWEGVRKLFTSQ